MEPIIILFFVVSIFLLFFLLRKKLLSSIDPKCHTHKENKGKSKSVAIHDKKEAEPIPDPSPYQHSKPPLLTDQFGVIQQKSFNIQNEINQSREQTNNLPPISNLQTLEITDDFHKAIQIIEEDNQNAFITGKAGTGKSTLLRYIADQTKKQNVILAPTGVAALNAGGCTIHSFFHFPAEPINPDNINHINTEIYKNIDCIFIDEISMVRADLLDCVDRFMKINGKSHNLPFGGAQVVFIGDPFQLPPIVETHEEALLFGNLYRSPWFFDAHVMTEQPVQIINLHKVFRQKDCDFISLLDAIRTNQWSYEQLSKINERYMDIVPDNEDYITLTATNRRASEINLHKLSRLSPPEYSYQGNIDGDFNIKTLPVDLNLRLRVGARVIFVKNDLQRRWVNGTIGRIVELNQNSIKVMIIEKDKEFIYQINKEKWENKKYIYDYTLNKVITEVIGTYTQYPIKLAWAITIHKSQGLTFDKVIIDLGNGAFSNGQTYVALSRCRSFDGIILKHRIQPNDIKVDDSVIDFFRKNSIL